MDLHRARNYQGTLLPWAPCVSATLVGLRAEPELQCFPHFIPRCHASHPPSLPSQPRSFRWKCYSSLRFWSFLPVRLLSILSTSNIFSFLFLFLFPPLLGNVFVNVRLPFVSFFWNLRWNNKWQVNNLIMIKIVDEKSKLDKVRCELEEKELLLCFFFKRCIDICLRCRMEDQVVYTTWRDLCIFYYFSLRLFPIFTLSSSIFFLIHCFFSTMTLRRRLSLNHPLRTDLLLPVTRLCPTGTKEIHVDFRAKPPPKAPSVSELL